MLHTLTPSKGARKNRKRVGRGPGSGHGTTSCRGSKGHNARSGGGVRPGFEGGQMPLQRRLPKVGFTNIFRKEYAVVNIRDLEMFEKETLVDQAMLINSGLVKGRKDGVKLLGNGDITKPLTIRIDKVSKSAKDKIIAAGGTVEES